MKVFASLGALLTLFFGSFRYAFVPTVVFDAADLAAPMSSRASGHLYGLAEENVPDALMAESLDISSASQKVIDGLQHPIGDIDHVAANLGRADYLVVYLQDAYDTWYYDNDKIIEARKNGTYDPDAFLHDDFFPRVKEKVTALMTKDYADRLVYCPFNECDNGVWFGTWTDNSWCAFDDEGQLRFLNAWKETYDYIRSLDPTAKIGGPGYCDYAAWKEARFLSFCAENDCLPDVMIWHELGEKSAEEFDLHVANYRNLEALEGIDPLPVIVTEYGMMEECGDPAKMFRYVLQIEETGVWGNIAYWRLSNNLNDNSADGVSPNACWWLYRWYADMDGSRMAKQIRDLFHEDFGKAVKEGREARHKHLEALGCISDDKNKISVLTGGADYGYQIKIKNVDATALGKKVRVRVESVTYQGLTGKVFAPTLLFERDMNVLGGTLTVKLPTADPDAVYHIEVTPATGAPKTENKNLPARYEAERGTLLGQAYTYDSAYATTGEIAGMVGGMERPGDGVSIPVKVNEAGVYDLTLVYGKHNDLGGADGRVSGRADLSVNGQTQTLVLPNTIRSEYTSALHVDVSLEKGENTLVFTHNDGTFVLDSLLLTKKTETDIAVLYDADRSSESGAAFLVVAPENGYYTLSSDAAAFTVNGSKVSSATVFLRQGLNLIETAGGTSLSAEYEGGGDPVTVLPSDMALTDCKVENGVLTGVSSEGGSAAFAVSVPAAGDYCLTFTYSNNQESGVHAYNVDLVEAYFTLTVNGEQTRVWCRNTYSRETFATVTVNVRLKAGENRFVLSNDGAVRFVGRPSFAPDLKELRIDPVSK
ncbi:MAG: hypothetical protein IK104_02710 [Clostridia bacterium]|nr:hypothetical protein [Clostridia bacterium]